MSRTKMNETRNRKWLDLYLSGISVAAIANLYGCTLNNVYYGIKKIAPAAVDGTGRKREKAEAVTNSEYKTIILQGKVHVLRYYRRMGVGEVQPNYVGSGMALCGVLRDGETLHGWIKRHGQKRKISSD